MTVRWRKPLSPTANHDGLAVSSGTEQAWAGGGCSQQQGWNKLSCTGSGTLLIQSGQAPRCDVLKCSRQTDRHMSTIDSKTSLGLDI